MTKPKKDCVARSCLSILAPTMARNKLYRGAGLSSLAGDVSRRPIPSRKNLTGIIPSSFLSKEKLKEPQLGPSIAVNRLLDFLNENSDNLSRHVFLFKSDICVKSQKKALCFGAIKGMQRRGY